MQNTSTESERLALANAIQRCHNPNHPDYSHYGARGISVVDEWRGWGGFAKFLAHIGPKPSPELTIERNDNDLGYQHGNVRWATRSEQPLNRRRPSRPREHYTVRRIKERDAAIYEAVLTGTPVAKVAATYDLTKSQVYRINKRERERRANDTLN